MSELWLNPDLGDPEPGCPPPQAAGAQLVPNLTPFAPLASGPLLGKGRQAEAEGDGVLVASSE